MFVRRLSAIGAVGLVIALLALAGCGSGTGSGSAPSTAPKADRPTFMFFTRDG